MLRDAATLRRLVDRWAGRRSAYRIPAIEMFALAAVAAPCVFLALNRGGTLLSSQSVMYAWVLGMFAIWTALQLRVGRTVRIPLGIALLLAWPVVQLLPWPGGLITALAPERAAELREFAGAGVAQAATLSLYPYATVRALLMLAASVALFLLTRDLCRRAPSALHWLAAAVVMLALIEAAGALRQYFLIQTGAASGASDPTDYARGTFGNRNLLAACLVGCYGAALGLAAGLVGSTRRSAKPEAHRIPTWLALFGGLAAVLSAIAVIATFSRMGILALGAVTCLFGIAEWRYSRSGLIAPLALGAAAILGASAIGLPSLARRYAPEALAIEKHGRLAMWADSAGAARRYWLLGSGAGAFSFAFRRSHPYLTSYTIDHPHNEYLETAVEWGIPAAVILTGWIFVAVLRRLRQLAHAAAGTRELGLGCLAGAFGILVHATVDFPLRIPAILGLFCILLGIASAAGRRPAAPLPSMWGRAGAVATALVSAGLAALSLWGRSPDGGEPKGLDRWNVEAHYGVAQDAFREARMHEVEPAYRRALNANPYAAPVWGELALLLEGRGDVAGAWRHIRLAEQLEPHTGRGQWAAGNLRLRLGDVSSALDRFGSLVRHAPDQARAVWEVCWSAGVNPDRILGELVGPALLEEYVRYLLDRQRWEAVVEAAARATRVEARRGVFERLFLAGRLEEIDHLWNRVAPFERRFANGDLASPLRGYGLDWVVWPVDGVEVERRSDGDGYRLDVDFLSPRNLSYAGVTHDFAVAPGREYLLRLEARADRIRSNTGVEMEVISPRRRLAASEPFLRSTGWRAVELRFRPSADESVCRLRVLRRAGAGFDNQISGRFSLRRVTLTRAEQSRISRMRRAMRSTSSSRICG